MLPLSPLQSNLPRAQAVRLLEDALEAGVTFFDTAELYQTYPLVRDVLRPPAVVATKAYAYTYEGMRDSLKRALAQTRRERIDLFLLHEQESRLTLAGHAEALRCLVEARKAGVVGAVGVSTHAPAVVDAASQAEDIDIIHPLVNYRGLGLLEGTLDEMLAAIAKAGRAGKGVYAMKILGGGHLGGLSGTPEGAFAFIRAIRDIHAVAVGVKSREELLFDLALLVGEVPSPELAAAVAGRRRGLFVEKHCEGCGKCVERCRYGALSLVEVPVTEAAPAAEVAPAAEAAPVAEAAPAAEAPADRAAPTATATAGDATGAASSGGRLRVTVDQAKCVLCGYCAAACRDFYIKVV